MKETWKTVYLYGWLGDKYGREGIKLFSGNIPDTVRGLDCFLGRGFRKELASGHWHIVLGDRLDSEDYCTENDTQMTEAEVNRGLESTDIHIFPRMEGDFIAIGVAIAAAASAIGGAAVSAFGALAAGISSVTGLSAATGTAIATSLVVSAGSMALQAIVSAISSPNMDYDKAEVDRAASFLYNGVVNVVEQGGPVQLILGKFIVGSTVISASMATEELGEIDNILPVRDVNFGLPPINWSFDASTIAQSIILNPYRMTLAKTSAAGINSSAWLTIDLEPDTTYRMSMLLGAITQVSLQLLDPILGSLGVTHVAVNGGGLRYAQMTCTTPSIINPGIGYMIAFDQADPASTFITFANIKLEKIDAAAQ